MGVIVGCRGAIVKHTCVIAFTSRGDRPALEAGTDPIRPWESQGWGPRPTLEPEGLRVDLDWPWGEG
ncbi:MAG: hypothetical protein LVS60_10240 [Nodosilinea sp. LVE1205-7]|jgi:hypothetical protein